MSFFVQSTDAPTPKTANVRIVSLLLAGIFMIMVVAQLFTFEDYSDVIASITGLSIAPATIVSAMIVVFEVAALPFLFSMRLSVLGRVVSMFSGWLTAIGWFLIALYANVAIGYVSNGGVLGATVSLPSGWWMVFFFVGVIVLMIWSSWGMWPLTRSLKK
ncbi:MAG TPA: hypothetical protein VLG09_03735 [Candidatus Saccharimonadales bacterium]|nr:hypothetical protein [Candidatus Saccharimonadales bacterium]